MDIILGYYWPNKHIYLCFLNKMCKHIKYNVFHFLSHSGLKSLNLFFLHQLFKQCWSNHPGAVIIAEIFPVHYFLKLHLPKINLIGIPQHSQLKQLPSDKTAFVSTNLVVSLCFAQSYHFCLRFKGFINKLLTCYIQINRTDIYYRIIQLIFTIVTLKEKRNRAEDTSPNWV